jgi:Cof subfamily protein (haloacid dehalogenase superfamily)
MMRYRMLAVDLDHTLLRGLRGVSLANRDALARARAAGCQVVICTGRGRFSTLPVAEELDLLDGPHLLFNGAALFSSLRRPPDEVLLLEREAVEHCLQLAGSTTLGYSGFEDPRRGDAVHCAQPNEELLRWMEANQDRAAGVESVDEVLARPLVAFLFWGAEAQMRELRERLGDPPGVSPPRVATSKVLDSWVLELSAPGATKGAAISRLAGRLGITAHEIIAIGDAHPDICMIEYAGLGVAVGDGAPEVCAVADYVAPPCDEDAVAHVVERFILSDPGAEP